MTILLWDELLAARRALQSHRPSGIVSAMTATDWMLAEALGIERRAVETTALYRICVRDLVVGCHIGVHDYEKGAPQRVRVNAELLVEGRIGRDEFRHVVNYETIVDGIRALSRGRHINLVETFGDRILDLCCGDARVVAAQVRIEKLDVYPEAESIGVVMKRRRGAGRSAAAG